MTTDNQQAPVAGEVGTPRTDALATAPIDPAVNYASAKLTNALNLCAELEHETQSLSAQVEALKRWVNEWKQTAERAEALCEAAEQRADHLQAELDAAKVDADAALAELGG